MESKKPIVMIILVFIFFCSQLAAEEVVGKSIFPGIETPHPYPVAVEGNTLVWSETIHEPGAAWIKIHFTKFSLNNGDYVNLINMNGQVIERIKGKHVAGKYRSKFNVKNIGGEKVSFWGPAIDGDTVVVELYRKSNKKRDWGFTIDEVGVGSKAILNMDLELDSDTEEKVNMFIASFWEHKPKTILMGYRGNTADISGNPLGKMLYRKDVVWYTCNGVLNAKTGKHFFPGEGCIDSQDIVDTLEVRFFFEYTKNGSVHAFSGYYTYYGASFVDGNFKDGSDYLTLRNDYDMVHPHRNNGKFKKNVPLPRFYAPASSYAYFEIIDQEIVDDWEEVEFEPPLDETDPPNETVLYMYVFAADDSNNWYDLKIAMNEDGELALVEMEPVELPSGIQAASITGISRTSVGPWWPVCCYVQKSICDVFKSIFWWLNLNCTGCFNNCLNKVTNPCHSCDPWGLAWLLCIWFGQC